MLLGPEFVLLFFAGSLLSLDLLSWDFTLHIEQEKVCRTLSIQDVSPSRQHDRRLTLQSKPDSILVQVRLHSQKPRGGKKSQAHWYFLLLW